jgi:hypothetical protein
VAEKVLAGLPDSLTDLPPGPELAALLSTVDPTTLSAQDLVELLAARNRQSCHDQARQLHTIRELAYSQPGPVGGPPLRRTIVDPHTDTEIAFALTWTDYAANMMLSVAFTVLDKVPAVGEAMLAGQCDLDKAKVFTTELGDCDPPQARHVAARILPEIDRLTGPQLREAIRKLLLTIDPETVRDRHDKAVADRNVQHDEYANGTAAIAAVYLPKDKAAAAWDHIDAIARATKASGLDTRTIDQLRADVMADLLAGVDPTLAGTAAAPATRKGVVNLHLNLSTFACLDDLPGELAGFGPLLADIARQTAQQMADHAQWRFSVHGSNGGLVAEGRLRYRPTTAQANFVNARDRTCRAPGCRRPAQRCDHDHLLDWALGGATLIPNLCSLCRRHHRAKHVGRFTVTRGPHGFDWTSPRGHRYTVLLQDQPPPSPIELTITSAIHGHQRSAQLRR